MLGKTLSSNLESHRKIPQAVTLEEAQALNLPENLHELPNNLLWFPSSQYMGMLSILLMSYCYIDYMAVTSFPYMKTILDLQML